MGTFFKKLTKSISFPLMLAIIGLSAPTVLAAGGDMAITDANVYFSTSVFVENTPVTIYAIGTNNGQSDLLGTVQFWNSTTGKQIGSDQPISILSESTDTVFVVWYPTGGTQTVTVTLTPWTSEGDDANNNTVTKTITADYDTDGDGVGNPEDTDDDNDGYQDSTDIFPLNNAEWLDTDSDGIGNNADPDDDNDAILDEVDQMPLDYTETLDTDGDSIGNNTDTDDDGDGLIDEEETTIGTDTLNPDTDNDGYSDSEDTFPFDIEEGEDFDEDGTGDNADLDDDNDGILDETDTDNHNKAPYIAVDTEGFPIKFTDQEVTLTAEDSYDEDGSIEHYEWIVDGETVSVQPIYAATFLESGNQEIDLVITDDKGEKRTETVTINIHSKGFMIFLGFFILLLLLLAFYIIFKYNPRSREATSKGNSLSPKKKKKASKK